MALRLDNVGIVVADLDSSEVVQYEETYRLCSVRGPEGILLGLAQAIG